MKISVVIPALNEEKMIEDSLKSINNQTLPRKDYEIIVVDGKSSDKTVEIARKYADRVLVGNYKPIGLARDIGLRKAKGEIVAQTDADTIVPNNWLESFIKAFEDKRVVGAFGNLRYKEKTIPSKFYERGARLIILFFKHVMPMFHGFNICVRKNAALEVGGFVHALSGEDYNIGKKLKKIGKVVYVPVDVETSARRLLKNPIKTLLYYGGFIKWDT